MSVYLDYNATTPVDRRVLEAMLPYFTEEFGNAGSRTHTYGLRAKEGVERARKEVAAVVDAGPEDVVFTSGATESDNLAILGLEPYGRESDRRHIVSTVIEHHAVLEPLEEMRRRGFDVDLVAVTPGGFVEPERVLERVRSDTLLVSVMHANNETGVLQPLNAIGEALKDHPAFFHTDAAQGFGKELSTLRDHRLDLISVSGHKISGPKGIGALVRRRRKGKHPPLRPLIFGGGQERGLRAGTLPVPLIVGFGCASRLAVQENDRRSADARAVRKAFFDAIGALDHRVNGDEDRVLPHVVNVSFRGVDAEAVMVAAKEDFAFSNGSACTSASYRPSHVLQALGLDAREVAGAIRISWGPGVTAPSFESLRAIIESCRL
jgi:cysteine desulfurase